MTRQEWNEDLWEDGDMLSNVFYVLKDNTPSFYAHMTSGNWK